MIRLFKIVVSKYPVHCVVVLLSIIISSLAGVAGTLFLKNLIDDYITPFIGKVNPDFTPLFKALVLMGSIYVVGVITSYLYSRLMVNVTQGTLRDLRQDVFKHMESLEIRYFDTHSNGDTMSIYTNDIDTLRQMLSQSVPQ